MDSVAQYKPHLQAAFEGYYSNFQLSDGGRIILIICTVRGAKTRPHMISFTYCPSTYKTKQDIYQKEIWVNRLDMINDSDFGFTLDFPDGRLTFSKTHTDYYINHTDLEFHARVANQERLTWLPGERESPEGVLALLPLPLHWQVYSLASPAELSWNIKDSPVHTGSKHDAQAHVHQEKNWATSFPSAHIWVQARNSSSTSGINIAGGSILGLHSYLMTYHSTKPIYSTATRPPLSTLLPLPNLLNPTYLTTVTSISYPTRTVHLDFLTSLRRKIVIDVTADSESFFPLSAPFSEGHRENFLVQSMRARAMVRVFEIEEMIGFTVPFVKGWRLSFGTHWKCVHEDVFEDAGLEFGGEWYGDRG
ncbi:hypothetical protein H2198_002823 [Neophaeococcomyces mojaviensis]|uniref:Uncharacterized protein n=1 Tax=Neophaeococcomyces mojaviensis TaxID=3383035 RepID=A0ACC3ADG2_9EURO|nr:hypothetical protein H2198_002823 [Knufia sp. JES_112]